jgi:hypothetical protein
MPLITFRKDYTNIKPGRSGQNLPREGTEKHCSTCFYARNSAPDPRKHRCMNMCSRCSEWVSARGFKALDKSEGQLDGSRVIAELKSLERTVTDLSDRMSYIEDKANELHELIVGLRAELAANNLCRRTR